MTPNQLVDQLSANDLYSNLVWDYDLDLQAFAGLLTTTDPKLERQQLWALTRVVEHAPFYSMKKLISRSDFIKYWPLIRPRLQDKSQVQAYDYLAQKFTL